jgi:hypothetical protein
VQNFKHTGRVFAILVNSRTLRDRVDYRPKIMSKKTSPPKPKPLITLPTLPKRSPWQTWAMVRCESQAQKCREEQ